jgi:hypothetical protein
VQQFGRALVSSVMPDGAANREPLPDDPAVLKEIVRELLTTVREQQRQNCHEKT